MTDLKKKLSEGFTIIEVMIVLAIGGLILVVVLVAIPQLQRNQRNNARTNVVSRIVTEIGSYSGNNQGNIPETAAELNDVYDRYLGCTGSAAAPGTCEINVEGPSTGTPMPTELKSIVTGIPTAPGQDSIGYQTSSKCDGESIVGGTARNFAAWTVLEGGAIFCADNI